MSRTIEIVEVGPRDGLQNEKALLEVGQKLEFIHRLEAAGAVLVGDTADALWYLELIRSQEPIAGIRNRMMFGRSLALASEAA